MRTKPSNRRFFTNGSGFTLVEILLSMSIAMGMAVAIISSYMTSTNRVEWSVYSLAAQALALQQVEKVRAAPWDPDAGTDQAITNNFPPTNIVMDIPFKETNMVWATNITTISNFSTTPPLKWIRVDCLWSFRDYSTMRFKRFTNTVVTYRRPSSN